MPSDTTPQDPAAAAVAVLVAKFTPNYELNPMAPADPCDLSAMATFTAGDGHRSIRPLNFGEIVDCLAEAGLLAAPQVADEGGPERSDPKVTDETVHEVARAIRDAYEKDIPDPVGVTEIEDWYGEARAAISALRTVSRPASSTEDLT